MAQYLSSHHGIAVIDNAFSPEALEELLAFCEESTIWHDDGPNDYVPTAEGEAPPASVRDPLCAPCRWLLQLKNAVAAGVSCRA